VLSCKITSTTKARLHFAESPSLEELAAQVSIDEHPR